MTTPAEALQRLRRAEASGRLGELAERLGLALVVAFGSTARGEDTARDLDIAVGSRSGSLDLSAVVLAFMELAGTDAVDLLDLDRAGPVARQHALVPGEPLYEWPPGEFGRQQMRASGERLSTEWMRRLDLALMADDGMGPRRLDPSIVQARLSTMRALLDDLAAVVPDPDLETDRMLRHGVERILTQLVELAASINEHVAGAQVPWHRRLCHTTRRQRIPPVRGAGGRVRRSDRLIPSGDRAGGHSAPVEQVRAGAGRISR